MEIDITHLDTSEEIHFAWYLEELKEHGYIVSYDNHPTTFDLFGGRKFGCIRTPLLKRGYALQERSLLEGCTYTPDFGIYWTKKAKGIFYESLSDPFILDKNTPFLVHNSAFGILSVPDGTVEVSFVDVKPDVAKRFSSNLSTVYTFPILQKWVLEQTNVFVQKIIGEGKKGCLFATTFTPNRYLTTDKSGAARNIHHRTPTISMYVEEKEAKYRELCRAAGIGTVELKFNF